jgi:hypothetical protein
MRAEVRADLSLSAEQLSQLDKLNQSLSQRTRELFDKYRNAADEQERNRIRDEINRSAAESREQRNQAEAKFMADVLNAGQRERLQQLVWQNQNELALANGKLADELKVTEEQRNQIRDLIRQQTARPQFGRRTEPPNAPPNAPPAARPLSRTELREKALAVLTEEQRQAREVKLGAPLDSSPEKLGRYYFGILDRDQNGELTAEEWSQSSGTRTTVERQGIQLQLPAKVDAFTAAYVEARANSRRSSRDQDDRPSTGRGR